MEKISVKCIRLDSEAKTIELAFKEAAKMVVENGFSKNEQDVFNLFKEREKLSATGLEDGFAIPHAKGDAIDKSGIIYLRFKSAIKWETFDQSDVTDAIFFTIPENKGDEYLQRLAQLSEELSSKEFRTKLKISNLKNEVLKILNNINNKIDTKKNINSINQNKCQIKILGIVACPAGLAHTYMAKKAIEDAVLTLGTGYVCQVEAHGAMGIENKIETNLIDENSLLIQATDVGIDLENRFDYVYTYKTNTKEVIKDAPKVLDYALQEFKKFGKSKMIKKVNSQKESEFKTSNFSSIKNIEGKNKFTRFMKWWGRDTLKHLMTGISYLIPLAIAASVLIGISRVISAAMGYNDLWAVFPGDSIKESKGFLAWLFSLEYIGTKFGLATLFVPFITAFICYSMNGKAGLAPGFLVGFVCMYKEMGFIGGMISGLATGYVIMFVAKYMQIKGAWASLTPILLVPVLGTLVGGSIAWWAFGYPFYELNVALKNGLTKLVDLKVGPALIALVFSAMIAFDLGGPVNKAAYGISLGIFSDETIVSEMARFGPNTAVQLSIILPPLALGLASFFGKNYYDEQLKNSGKAAFIMGVVGVSEGAIPFAIKNPLRVTFFNVLGCMAASTFVVGLNCVQPVNLSAFYSWGFPTKPLIYVSGVLIGVLIIMIPNVLLQKIQWHKETNTKFIIFSPIPGFINFGIGVGNIFRKKTDKKVYVETSATKFLKNENYQKSKVIVKK